MCEVDEENSGCLQSRSLPGVCKTCVKCKENTAVLIIRVGDAFCRSCFKEYFVHKFRAMLGKNRVIFPGEKVLLTVSGGAASSSMLAQVQEGLGRDAPKKLRFIPAIIYIDEGGVCGQDPEEREETVAQLETIFRKTGFPYHIISLEQVFSLPSSVLEPVPGGARHPGGDYKAAVDQYIQQSKLKQKRGEASVEEAQDSLTRLNIYSPPSPEHTQTLQRLFSTLKTLTAKEDLLQTLRQHLILHTARTHGYSKVMMGDSCTRLAIKLLTNISLGRGASLAADTGFSDSRYGDVVVVRPMRDYSSKEITFYNRLFGVESVFTPSLDTKAPDKASIQRLTESFIIKLQADFPSTVSTIYRTSEKLHTASSPQNSSAELSAKCLLCLCAADTKAEEASAFQATLLSERLSVGKAQSDPAHSNPASSNPASSNPAGSCCQEQGCGAGGCCSTSRIPAPTDLKTLLCYSCRLTIKDMITVEALPHYITSEAEKRQRRAQMKEEIGEFLLDEDEDAE
ncbi:cytoplasmic tRNA 2-thiolation protein 2 isoform X1 [Astyanax mexicanus]|uniref:Cytoplasmic tRNA 2-thiolation protein 2 n=1 Tax=Astyanax mexicanus TaxID=7994 RepID=A0A8T2KNK7_ASTMX|nr:cytoplasmic tRNA 2-thiolation protein 2 isoform X1 [Astyanax mexicanus]